MKHLTAISPPAYTPLNAISGFEYSRGREMAFCSVIVAKALRQRPALGATEYVAAYCRDIRGVGFAPHSYKNLIKEGGAWAVDAVYNKSPTLPAGPATFDAENHRGRLSGNWNTDGVRTYG